MASTAGSADPPWVSPAESSFIVHKGHRMWLDWAKAVEFATVLGIVQHRKQQVHHARLYGEDRWLWYVRRTPAATGTPSTAPAGTPSTTKPVLTVVDDHYVPTCEHRRGSWICTREPHRQDPDRHFFTHQKDAS